MAPEAMNWGEKIDYCSDIYSLGITMYQLLNDGNFPFVSGGEDVDEVYETIKKRENGTKYYHQDMDKRNCGKLSKRPLDLKKKTAIRVHMK